MARNPFCVFSRKITSKDGESRTVLYARYWDYENERILCTKSINELNFQLGDRSKKNIKSRNKASAIAQEALDKGLISNFRDSEIISFESYTRRIWDFDNSDYIRRRNQEKAGSITRIYADGQLKWLMREVFPYLPKDLKLAGFTVAMAERIKDRMLDEKKASSSINKVMQAIRTPLKEAYRIGILPADITDKILNIPVTHKKKGILTIAETLSLEKYLNNTTRKGDFERNQFLTIALAANTGMREGEIRALQPKDISILDEDTAIINIVHAYNDKDKLKSTKGKDIRQIACPILLAEELLEYSRTSYNDNPFIFYARIRKGVPVSAQMIERWFREALVAIGISLEEQKARNITFHSLRHGFATLARDAGCSADERKALIGHKSDSMMEHYTKETHEHLQEIQLRIEKRLPYDFL